MGAWSWKLTSISCRCCQTWSCTSRRPLQYTPRETSLVNLFTANRLWEYNIVCSNAFLWRVKLAPVLTIKRLNVETRGSQLLNISLFPSNLFESFQAIRLWKVYIPCTKILFRISTLKVTRDMLFFWPSSSKGGGSFSNIHETLFLEDIIRVEAAYYDHFGTRAFW